MYKFVKKKRMGNEQTSGEQIAATETIPSLATSQKQNDSKTELRCITVAELKSKNTEQECWLCIHGRVYDVTKFLSEHPGGDDILLDVAGAQDATQEFNNTGHSQTDRKSVV